LNHQSECHWETRSAKKVTIKRRWGLMLIHAIKTIRRFLRLPVRKLNVHEPHTDSQITTVCNPETRTLRQAVNQGSSATGLASVHDRQSLEACTGKASGTHAFAPLSASAVGWAVKRLRLKRILNAMKCVSFCSAVCACMRSLISVRARPECRKVKGIHNRLSLPSPPQSRGRGKR
jgi:hypothetical protein